MTTTIKPPKGWRWMKPDEIIRKGDKYQHFGNFTSVKKKDGGHAIGNIVYVEEYFIRRITKRKKRK